MNIHFYERVTNDSSMSHFLEINPSCLKPLCLWQAALMFPHLLKQLTFLVRLCVIPPVTNRFVKLTRFVKSKHFIKCTVAFYKNM